MRPHKLSLAPPTAQRLDQLHRKRESLPRQLRTSTLGLQRIPACIDHFEITDKPRTIAFGRKVGSAPRIRNRAILGSRLVRQMVDSSETILHFTEGDQNLLPIFCNRFLVRRLRALIFGPISATSKNWQ